MSHLYNDGNDVSKVEPKEEKIKSSPRSSSPAKATDEDELVYNKNEGIITRSAAKRKLISEQPENSKDIRNQRLVKQILYLPCAQIGEDFLKYFIDLKCDFFRGVDKDIPLGDINQEQLYMRSGNKRIRIKSRTALQTSSSADNSYSVTKEDDYRWLQPSLIPMSSIQSIQFRKKIHNINHQKLSRSRSKKVNNHYNVPAIFKLGVDDLERVCYYLDTKSAINLFMSCTTINERLAGCPGFWKELCRNENFHEYSALKLDDKTHETFQESQSSDNIIVPEVENKPVKSAYENKVKCVNSKDAAKSMVLSVKNTIRNDKINRLSWCGEKFHDVVIPNNATLWRKVYLRGIRMRKNICDGRFELWRLFLTDETHLPVKNMTSNTSFRELR